jgi:hypothetical protein
LTLHAAKGCDVDVSSPSWKVYDKNEHKYDRASQTGRFDFGHVDLYM